MPFAYVNRDGVYTPWKEDSIVDLGYVYEHQHRFNPERARIVWWDE